MANRGLLAVCLLLASQASVLAETRPTVMHVHVDHSPVRSGPGEQFYATDELHRGAEVAVYRHDPGGWLAIRPPEGSFSWVPESALRHTDEEGLAEVASTTEAIVGSGLVDEGGSGTREEVHYVRLRRGELVEVLGREERPREADGAARVWYRIRPPAGEFRWIHEGHVGQDPPPALEASADSAPDGATENDVVLPDGREENAGEDEAAEQATHSILLTTNTEPIVEPPSLVNVTDAFVPKSTLAPAAASSPSALVPPPASAAFREISKTVVSSTAPANPLSGMLDQELTGISCDLSLAVTGDPSTWRLDSVRRRTQSVIDAGSTPATREAARRLLAEIAQFEDLQRRHMRLRSASSGDPTHAWASQGSPHPLLAGSATVGLPNAQALSSRGAAYDGQGYLMPVVAAQRGVPRYALTDGQGRILQFVVPAPGVNLRRYERQEVGIMGSRGASPGLRPPLLTAERIVLLNRHR